MKYIKLFKYRFNVLQIFSKILVYVLIISLADIFFDLNLFGLREATIITLVIASGFQYEGFSLEYLKITDTKFFNLELVNILLKVITVVVFLIILYVLSGVEFLELTINVYDSYSLIDVILLYVLLVIIGSFLITVLSRYLAHYALKNKLKYFAFWFSIFTLIIGLPMGLYLDYTFGGIAQNNMMSFSNINVVGVVDYLSLIAILISFLLGYIMIKLNDLKIGY